MSSIPATSNGFPVSYDRIEASIGKPAIDASLDGTTYAPYWLRHPDRPAALPSLEGNLTTDLLVVGGGYCGLWTALLAKEENPDREVVLIEGQTVGWAASGRNGGFCEASLVHGESNGEKHLPGENQRLAELGAENLAGIIGTVKKYDIDCDLVESGVLTVATEKHQVQWLKEEAAQDPELVAMDASHVRTHIDSPLFEGGNWDRHGTVLVHPAKLAWGLRRVCLNLGVRIFEHTKGEELISTSTEIRVRTGAGHITARSVALATNAFPSLLKRHRLHTIPVFDYALMTEPLTAAQRQFIGWKENMGLADMNNRFHYSRPTIDEDGGWRLLYGGYDAIYHYGREVKPQYDRHDATFRKLAAHFLGTFPQLEGIKFSHAWGGAIDTCSRFFAFFDTSHSGRVAYCAGFTGLGVGATRFGARVMLDLLSGSKTELTELEMARKKPLPFPPEPAAWLGVKLMTHGLVQADRNEGRRGPFLRAMDAVGMGFDS
ncbi:NAD(P)/FAD-dependent oxidoreductase [Paeniglutamicibacter sulfureus]|uniref:Glycine/D-amino acid oxidase-like deaminating enzyme n=1 Tax=Paeniglutamicibacter sulfureus TaxID=43666 RepID=A0ABU2BMM9_9MICC|nr:FAD-binding oxidoreductase [Paeniglutamicibacter sulfureus]MDR7359501.1 glycine/D-amino acid oxidase-like deaminating enzyme [Paeniglutamicibacter sulfureus]